jgi:hypothetical protein
MRRTGEPMERRLFLSTTECASGSVGWEMALCPCSMLPSSSSALHDAPPATAPVRMKLPPATLGLSGVILPCDVEFE